jgi:hypothetical protein
LTSSSTAHNVTTSSSSSTNKTNAVQDILTELCQQLNEYLFINHYTTFTNTTTKTDGTSTTTSISAVDIVITYTVVGISFLLYHDQQQQMLLPQQLYRYLETMVHHFDTYIPSSLSMMPFKVDAVDDDSPKSLVAIFTKCILIGEISPLTLEGIVPESSSS